MIPPVAVMVLNLPVVAIMVPPVHVPEMTGLTKVGVVNDRLTLNSPVPVWHIPISASTVEKLLARCEVTLTVSDVVAIIRPKLGDVVLI